MNHALNSASRHALAHHSVPVWPPFQARGVAFHRDLSPTGRHCFRIPAPGLFGFDVVAPGSGLILPGAGLENRVCRLQCGYLWPSCSL